ncbi:hypothetical protein AK830_g5417 [Neonectria ditissima]|uniref:Amidohydrolase 3 domain-containing protein n=1 Tax=Neonectria ditissima TaxID=78410 RepID=A0A0P7BLU9_9HYPO|nr:hypothetical protein AK830_g5417 [Neonectria ditissima]
MPGCLEGYHAAASQILKHIDHNDLLAELGKQVNGATSASPESQIFYSSTNPAPIITMKNGQFSAVAAMAIENGKVLKTGSLDEVKAAATSANAPTDLKDNCIVPGFVEPHVHIITSAMLEGFLLNCDPLNEGTGGTFEGTIAYMQQAAQKLPEGGWLLGYGYDPSRLEPYEGAFRDLTIDVFNANELNEHPILILNASGHIAYANITALNEANIDVDKTYNGVLVEPPAFLPIIAVALPGYAPDLPQVKQGFVTLLEKWSRKGFTTVFDAGVGNNAPQNPILDANTLYGLTSWAPLRIAGAAADLTPGMAAKIVTDQEMPAGGATNLKIKTIKLWMDGSTQGFTGALEEKYELDMLPSYFQNAPYGWAAWEVNDTCHITPASNRDIYTEMQMWASLGYQLMVHVNGDCASEVVMDAFERLETPNPNLRHRMEHFTVTSLEQVQRAAKLNLNVSHTIGHVKYWGHTFKKYILGDDRAERIDPVHDDVENGLVYSLHSDSPVSQADGLSYVRTAATRLMYIENSKKPEDVLGPSQRVSVEEALAGITINPARQTLLDDEVGTLEEGKSADFVVLKKDIASPSIDASDISSDWVLETWFQGRRMK